MKTCHTITSSNGADWAGLEAEIRDTFMNRHDGFGNHQEWPQPAAAMFATAPWRFHKVKQ
jgi:hypothetical protein